VKGFVVIESDLVLDVVAVYTAAGSDGQVRTMAVERVTPRRLEAGCPDLIIETIQEPIGDSTKQWSIIRAVVRNIGSATAGASFATVIDPTTLRPDGRYYEADANTPVLDPGESASVFFYLPYWVYNPDVTLEVTADYKGMVSECNEDNNMKVFKDIG
jgi:subtilase family serine protease